MIGVDNEIITIISLMSKTNCSLVNCNLERVFAETAEPKNRAPSGEVDWKVYAKDTSNHHDGLLVESLKTVLHGVSF